MMPLFVSNGVESSKGAMRVSLPQTHAATPCKGRMKEDTVLHKNENTKQSVSRELTDNLCQSCMKGYYYYLSFSLPSLRDGED